MVGITEIYRSGLLGELLSFFLDMDLNKRGVLLHVNDLAE
jgi:hypothetical protein